MYIKKAFSFIFIDFNSTYPNYYHPLNYIPILLLGLFSVAGIIVSNKKSPQMNYLILFFLANVAIVALFFVLPRYKLSIIPLQIIFSNIFFEYLKNKFFKKL